MEIDRTNNKNLNKASSFYIEDDRDYSPKEIYENSKRMKDLFNVLNIENNIFRSLLENIGMGITVIDKNFKIMYTNAAQNKLMKKPAKYLIQKYCYNQFEKRSHVCNHCPGKIAMKTKKPAEVETEGVRDDGSKFPVHIDAYPFFDSNKKVMGFIEVVKDISERKRLHDERREYYDKLKEANITLSNVIAHIEKEKISYQENISLNIEKNIIPIIEKMKLQKSFDFNLIKNLENSLSRIHSSFIKKLINYKYELTPSEIKICQYVRQGYLAKEIAELLGVAPSTINEHKSNIRKKFGINNSSINLKTYLDKLPDN